jgi:hypothetical protein
MANKSSVSSVATEDRVRAVAYSLWLDEGQPHGRAEAHWLKAVELVNAEAAINEFPAPKPKRKAPAAAARKAAAPAKRAPAKKKG